jgi:hypothetical protein
MDDHVVDEEVDDIARSQRPLLLDEATARRRSVHCADASPQGAPITPYDVSPPRPNPDPECGLEHYGVLTHKGICDVITPQGFVLPGTVLVRLR